MGIYIWFFREGILSSHSTNYTHNMFHLIGWMMVLLLPPVVSMTLLEEIRNKTLNLLLSKPLSLRKIIAGKFVAIAIFITIFLSLTFIYFLTISYFSDTTLWQGTLTYLFLFFMGLSYTAIIMSISSFCTSYLKTILLSFLSLFIIHFFFDFLEKFSVGIIHHFFEYIGIYHRLNHAISTGISLDSLTYLLSIIVVGTTITYFRLKQINE